MFVRRDLFGLSVWADPLVDFPVRYLALFGAVRHGLARAIHHIGFRFSIIATIAPQVTLTEQNRFVLDFDKVFSGSFFRLDRLLGMTLTERFLTSSHQGNGVVFRAVEQDFSVFSNAGGGEGSHDRTHCRLWFLVFSL